MNTLLDRVLINWKTTAGGILAVAAVIVGAFVTNGGTSKGFSIAGAIIAGLIGLLSKDA